jgi:hypothetical protein
MSSCQLPGIFASTKITVAPAGYMLCNGMLLFWLLCLEASVLLAMVMAAA